MLNVLFVLLLFFLFFSYALVSLQLIFPIIAIGIVFVFLIKNFNKSIVISRENQIWLICVMINFVGLIRTPKINDAVVFAGFILVFVLLKISLSNSDNWKGIFIKYALFFSSIHVVSTLMQFFNPSVLDSVNKLILPSAAYNINRYQLSIGKYAGITGQVGANAFFITISLAVSFCFLVENKKKYLTGLMFILGLCALVLTTKRGLLLFNITTIVAVFLIVRYAKLKKNNRIALYLIITLMAGLLAIIGISLLGNLPLFNQMLADDNSASERLMIYRATFELIKSSPLIGNGLNSVENYIGIKAHNIYLQLWAELGIVGLIVYTSAMMVTLINSIKLYVSKRNQEHRNSQNTILMSIYIQIIFILYGLTGNVLYDYFIVGMYMVAISLSGLARVSLRKTRYSSVGHKIVSK